MSNSQYAPKVCVLLAAYNGEAYIAEQIESILAQVDVSVSLFISLDQSNDKSLELCRDYAAKFDNVYLLDYGTRYGSAGKNFFRLLTEVNFSDFDYVSLADQDDIWMTTKLNDSIRTLRLQHAEAVSTNVTAFWDDGTKSLIDKAQPQTEYDFLFESAGPGCTFVLSRNAAQQVQQFLRISSNGLEQVHWHDWLIYAFCRSRNIPWVISSQSTMMYRQHQTNETGANAGIKPFIQRVKVVLFGNAISRVLAQAKILNLETSEPMRRLTLAKRKDFLWLAFNAAKLRRRTKDKVLAFLAFLAMAVRGSSTQ